VWIFLWLLIGALIGAYGARQKDFPMGVGAAVGAIFGPLVALVGE
jgi:hypothetical protein